MRTLTFERAMVADAVLKPIVEKAIQYDERAWHRFQEIVWPGLELVAGRWRSCGHLSRDVDERRTVATIVIARFARDKFEGLQRLDEVLATGNDNGWPWICQVTARKAQDHERAQRKTLGHDVDGVPVFARLVGLSPRAEELLPDSVRGASPDDRTDAKRVMAYAERKLSPPQLQALTFHFLGDSDECIADTLKLAGPRDAYRLWHGAVNRLKYHFVVKGSSGLQEKK